MTYLTPIPSATLYAYHGQQPIQTKLEAAIVARKDLLGSRLQPIYEPRLLSIEDMTLAEAYRRMGQTRDGENRPENTPVWLVLYDGYLQLFPPDPFHTYTPAPPQYGCIHVILDRNDGSPIELGGTKCPPCHSGICLTAMPALTELLPIGTPHP